MKKLWTILVASAVLLTTAAAFSGWRLNRWAGRDAMSVGVIGAADGPASGFLAGRRWQSVANAFFRLTVFFAGSFSSLEDWRCTRRVKRQAVRKSGQS